MTAWIKGNKVTLSLITLVTAVYMIIHLTMAFSAAENKQDKEVAKNQSQIESNAKAICDLQEILKSHLDQYGDHLDEERKNSETRTRLTSDLGHIKESLAKIERKLE